MRQHFAFLHLLEAQAIFIFSLDKKHASFSGLKRRNGDAKPCRQILQCAVFVRTEEQEDSP
jgi:hypothetical protein